MKNMLIPLIALLAFKAQAGLIQFNPNVSLAAANSAPSIGSAQRIGSRFTLTDSYIFTDIATWLTSMNSSQGISLDLDLVIYSADSDLLLPQSKLYSKSFNPGADASLDWYGVSGINWALNAGTYFLALEAELGLNTPYGYVYQAPISMDFDSPGLAWNIGWGDFAYGSSWGQEIAMKFEFTDVNSVPEPHSFLLLFPALLLMTRKKLLK